MFSGHVKVPSIFHIMLFTGIILAPTTIATPALQDLIDLRTVVNAAANTIGDVNNPNRGWGFNLLGGNGQLGTADLVNNVTTTILRSKWQLDTNKTSWLLPSNLTDMTGVNLNDTQQPWTPTLPLSTSLALPSTLPTTSPTLENITTDLSTPYIDYVSAVPNLSSGLTSLGHSYHREMNSPVSQAIAGLQQSLSALQSSMLASNLIHPNAVIRTLRASSSLEDAQQAWSRFLNLPGSVSAPSGDSGNTGTSSDDFAGVGGGKRKRGLTSTKSQLAEGKYKTHKDLWGRDKLRLRHSMQGNSQWYDAFGKWEEQRARIGRGARVLRTFVA